MEKINLITTKEDFANLITELALEISAKQNFKWISEAVVKKMLDVSHSQLVLLRNKKKGFCSQLTERRYYYNLEILNEMMREKTLSLSFRAK